MLEHRHTTAETAASLCQFEADVAAAEHDQVGGQTIEFERLDVRERPGVHEAGDALRNVIHDMKLPLVPIVAQRLAELPRESEFVFTTLRGTHYTPSSRVHHWNRVRCGAQLGDVRLYDATRHYFAWYGLNVLGRARFASHRPAPARDRSSRWRSVPPGRGGRARR